MIPWPRRARGCEFAHLPGATATGLPVEWGPEKNVIWKAEIPGDGWSSPVVWKDRIFLTAAVPQDDGSQSLRVLGVEGDSGEIAWNVEVFLQKKGKHSRIHSKNSHASATPITDGKHLFVHFGTHGTACLTLDGGIVWKTQEIEYDPRHGNGGSPVLVDDLVIFSCDGYDVQFVIALDQKTGEIRWKTKRRPNETPKDFSFTTPLVIEVKGQKQLISGGTNQIVAYDPATGKELWWAEYDGYSVIPRPVYAEDLGLIFISTSYNNAVAMAIRVDGQGDVTSSHVAWEIKQGAPHTRHARRAVADRVSAGR